MTHEEGLELNEKYSSELMKIFPTFKFGNSNISSADNFVTSQQYDFSIKQEFLKDTIYYPNGQNEFIHYTTNVHS